MTTELFDDEQTARRLTQALEHEAARIEVPPAWDAIAGRLVDSEWSGGGLTAISGRRWRRRVLGAVSVCATVAAAILLAVVLGWRPAAQTPQPAAPPMTDVPRYDPTIPTLVVYRTTGGADRKVGEPVPDTWSVTPERLRTDSADIGVAALNALFDTAPVQPGNIEWDGQHIDITSVTVAGGLIRVELRAFASTLFDDDEEAHLMAQAWVRTLQDTLGVRDDVLITVQGQPLILYGSVDTTESLRRDGAVRVVRPDGFDSPRAGDVVPRTFVLLGSVAAGATQPGRIVITNVDTRELVYDEDVPGVGAKPAPVNFEPVLTLAPGRYRAALIGHGSDGVRDITFTVVQ